MTPDYDVIIVGGGMVGATLAAALSQQASLNIALIEAYQPATLAEHDPPDLRVSALNRASETLLNNLNIWQKLIPQRISVFTDMHVWESASSNLHFDSAEIGEAALGHIIENRHLQQAILSCCQQQKNIEFICPAKPTKRENHILTLDNGRTLTAPLIVAADGALSPLKEWAGIKTHGWNYKQSAVVCSVTSTEAHQQTAWQHFLTDGPLAFLPLADAHQCSIVWSTSSEEAVRLCNLGDEEFIYALEAAFEKKLGTISHVSKRASFPLQLRHADHYVEEGFALVGDAAHTIHPLAGQGVNIGLLDAATLAEVIMAAEQQGRNIGSLHTLNKYQRRRKGDNVVMQLTMDAFKHVFGNELAPIGWARRFGLKTVNNSTLLKNLFMRQATGHRFANPKLTKQKF